MTLPLVMYGSYTCEDTAFTRDRLRTLRVPFKESMKEDAPQVGEILAKYNSGSPRTPTLVFGDSQAEIVIAEPTIEQLEETLTKAGYTFDAPKAQTLPTRHHAPDLTTLPAFRSDAISGETVGRPGKIVVLFAHSEGCRVCQGYTKQIVARVNEFRDRDAHLRIVLHTDLKSAENWAKEFAPGIEIRADDDGAMKREFADYLPDQLDVRPGGAWLLILDRDEMPRLGVYGPDAGGLISPTQIIQCLTEWDF